MFKAFGWENVDKGAPTKQYEYYESYWLDLCKEYKIEPAICRNLYWDIIQQQPSSMYWGSYLKNMYIPHNINSKSLSITLHGKRHIIPNTALNYYDIRKALLENRHDEIEGMLDTGKIIGTISCGDVHIQADKIFYKNQEIHNSACSKLLSLIGEGLTPEGIEPWLKFIDKLMSNPSFNCREQAYKFLEHNGMPLTKNGNIIGYKGSQK